jgi:hypothetical protein
MATKKNYRVCVMLKSGKHFNINPTVKDNETEEGAANRILKDILRDMENGARAFTLVNSAGQMNTIIVISEITTAYVGTVDPDQEAREKEERRIHHELLKHQLKHYKEVNKGNEWQEDED